MFFAVSRQEVLFLEHVSPRDLQRKRHFAIECIPIPRAAAAQADGAPTPKVCRRCPVRILMRGFSCGWAGYFKKALLESDEEWSQHEGSQCIDTRGKGIRRCVPVRPLAVPLTCRLPARYLKALRQDFAASDGCCRLLPCRRISRTSTWSSAATAGTRT